MKHKINKYVCMYTFRDTSLNRSLSRDIHTNYLEKKKKILNIIFSKHIFLFMLEGTNDQLWTRGRYCYLHMSTLMISKGGITASPRDSLCPVKCFQGTKGSQDP